MVVNLLEKLAKKHNDWIKIVRSFGCDKMTSEDLVQDMYIKIHYYCEKHDRSILYNKTEINYYFVFKALRTIWLNHVKDQNKIVDREVHDFQIQCNSNSAKEIQESIEEKLSTLYWYDRKIFELVYKDGISMLQISNKTGIDYCSIKRTIKKVKKLLK